MLLLSPDRNGILLYLIFQRDIKDIVYPKASGETAPKNKFDNRKRAQIKKNCNFTKWKHHLQNAYDHKN